MFKSYWTLHSIQFDDTSSHVDFHFSFSIHFELLAPQYCQGRPPQQLEVYHSEEEEKLESSVYCLKHFLPKYFVIQPNVFLDIDRQNKPEILYLPLCIIHPTLINHDRLQNEQLGWTHVCMILSHKDDNCIMSVWCSNLRIVRLGQG